MTIIIIIIILLLFALGSFYNVTIRNDVFIEAGSVITKSIPDGKIVAGNPAKIIGETNDFIKKIRPFDVSYNRMSYDEKHHFLLKLSDEKFIVK